MQSDLDHMLASDVRDGGTRARDAIVAIYASVDGHGRLAATKTPGGPMHNVTLIRLRDRVDALNPAGFTVPGYESEGPLTLAGFAELLRLKAAAKKARATATSAPTGRASRRPAK